MGRGLTAPDAAVVFEMYQIKEHIIQTNGRSVVRLHD